MLFLARLILRFRSGIRHHVLNHVISANLRGESMFVLESCDKKTLSLCENVVMCWCAGAVAGWRVQFSVEVTNHRVDVVSLSPFSTL
jgi:hypothetical protein